MQGAGIYTDVVGVVETNVLTITLASEQDNMSKFLVTRVRNQLEGMTIEAASSTEAIEKSRKTKRSEWSHLDSKRRHGYKAEKVDTSDR